MPRSSNTQTPSSSRPTTASPPPPPREYTNVPVLKFTLKTPVSFATLTSLKVGGIGQRFDSDTGIQLRLPTKIYRDANFNGTLDPAVDVLIGTATYLTPDPTGTVANTVAVNLFKPETINPTGSTYFIAYDFATGATSNNSEGVSINTGPGLNALFQQASTPCAPITCRIIHAR